MRISAIFTIVGVRRKGGRKMKRRRRRRESSCRLNGREGELSAVFRFILFLGEREKEKVDGFPGTCGIEG